MTQLTEHEALVAAMADVQPYRTGAIARAGRPTQWTVCDETKHLMFFSTPEDAERACRIENMRAVLAVIAERGKTWPVGKMTEAWLGDTLEGYSADNRSEFIDEAEATWRAMFAASPIVPGDGK